MLVVQESIVMQGRRLVVVMIIEVSVPVSNGFRIMNQDG
jgi:hypothetical protein